jgi:hypothetical protein
MLVMPPDVEERPDAFMRRFERGSGMKFSALVAPAMMILLALHPCDAYATSVRSVSVGEMAERSQLIFEGRVVTVASREGSAPSSIETCVLFEVIDLVKGEVAGNTLELCFAGGSVDGRGRWVAGMVYPEPGESGIYFVEDAERPLVNPIFGWDQGRFPIRRLPGDTAPRVTVAGGSPVVGLEPGEPAPRVGLSRGVALGVEIAPERGDPRPASTPPVQPLAPGSSPSIGQRPTTGTATAQSVTAASQPRQPLTPADFKAIIRGFIQEPAP